MPETVEIPAGEASATFTIDAVDDVDGISSEVRAAFTDDYFGHLVIEYRIDTVTGEGPDALDEQRQQLRRRLGVGEDVIRCDTGLAGIGEPKHEDCDGVCAAAHISTPLREQQPDTQGSNEGYETEKEKAEDSCPLRGIHPDHER